MISNNKFAILNELNLSYNHIKDDGVFYISNALGKSFFARNIILKENEITMEGANYLCLSLIKLFKKEKSELPFKIQIQLLTFKSSFKNM